MTAKANAHLLLSDGRTTTGIPGVKGRKLYLGPFSRGHRRFLELTTQGGVFPRISNGELFEGEPYVIPDGGPKVIMGRRSWTGALLAVSTLHLNFDEAKSGHFGYLPNAWPGAEMLSEPFMQDGGRGDANQHQLIAIPDGKFAIVCDQGCRYIRIDCQDGELFPWPATREELGHLLVRRAEILLFSVKSLRWTRHTLERLHLLGFWSHELSDRLRKLEIPKAALT